MRRFFVRHMHRKEEERDAGVALVLVVGSMLVLSMLALTALAYAMQSKGFARYAQDQQSAIGAARAGVQDYIAHLNRDDVYDQTLDCANTALAGPLAVGGPYPSGTCGYTASTPVGWLPVVAGSTDPMASSFHYRVTGRDNSTGTLTIQATGRVNDEYRTVEAVLNKAGSTDYVYYTNFEDADPANIQSYSPAGATTDICGKSGADTARYWYENRIDASDTHSPKYSLCNEIQFISADTLDGPVFSNDAVRSNGAHFLDGFESHNPSCATVTSSASTWNNCLRNSYGTTSTADFNGVQPTYSTDKLLLTDTSAAFASYPGCHYFGSTRVVFKSNGKMTVWNKKSVNGSTAPVAITVAGQPTPDCGNLGDLDSSLGATVDVPNNMVIYVASAPAAVKRTQCYAGELGGPGTATLPVGDRPATQPIAASGAPGFKADTNMAELTKYCAEGNLYAEGIVKGRVTLASKQSIIVTGDLVMAGGHGGGDLLGLVATNSVEIFHPRLATFAAKYTTASCGAITSGGSSWQYCPTTAAINDVAGWPTRYNDPTTGSKNPASGVQITGSIQTLQHSFYVQKYDEGNKYYAGSIPEILVYGSIAQQWRGIVGVSWGTSPTTYSGYAKTYSYDPQLVLSSPPYFPRWVNSQWLVKYSGELKNPADIKG